VIAAYPVVSEALVALRERIKEVLKKTLDEAALAEARKVRFGVVKTEVEHWKDGEFDPWVGVCARTSGIELQDGILDELRESPSRLLSLRATGLSMLQIGLKEPLGVTKLWDIPFSDGVAEGSEV